MDMKEVAESLEMIASECMNSEGKYGRISMPALGLPEIADFSHVLRETRCIVDFDRGKGVMNVCWIPEKRYQALGESKEKSLIEIDQYSKLLILQKDIAKQSRQLVESLFPSCDEDYPMEHKLKILEKIRKGLEKHEHFSFGVYASMVISTQDIDPLTPIFADFSFITDAFPGVQVAVRPDLGMIMLTFRKESTLDY